MLAILVERAWALEDFLVLLIAVTLGARFINDSDDVVWLAAAILASFRPFWPIAATVLMVAMVIIAAVTVALFIEVLVAAASWAMGARILIEVNFDVFSIGILIGGHDHLANPLW